MGLTPSNGRVPVGGMRLANDRRGRLVGLRIVLPPSPKAKRRNRKVPDPVPLELRPEGYQPSKVEEEAVDMPKMTKAQVRRTFLRPFRFERRDKGGGGAP